MTHLTAPTLVLSLATMFSSASSFAERPSFDKMCGNPAMKDLCGQSINILNQLPGEKELKAILKSPEVMNEQNSQMQNIMLKQDIWKTREDGGRDNIRFFRSSAELGSFNTDCASKGGKGATQEGGSTEKVQGLFYGVCIHPK